MVKIIVCKICKEIKEHEAHGMCGHCYRKEYREKHYDEIKLKERQYYKDHLEEIKERRRKRPSPVYSEINKDCGIYLGCHVAEKVLSYVFKNVQRMKMNNPGYDFVCGKGYKVDVKSSCIHGRDGRSDQWIFIINRNTIADFFLCLAFDNRNDLNPEYMWLIPGNVLNHLTGTSISRSTLNKWLKYEQSIDKVISCCDDMKDRDS